MSFFDAAQIGAEWQFDPIWEIPTDAEKMAGLKSALSFLTKGSSHLSPEKICQAMAQFLRDAYIPSHDLISRFIKSRKEIYNFKNKDHNVTLVFFIGRLRKEERSLFVSVTDPKTLAFLDYCEQYFETMSVNLRFRDRYTVRDTDYWASRSTSATVDLIKLINHLALPERAVFEADRLIFNPEEIKTSIAGRQIERHFVAYRYGVDVGQIFKSSVTIFRRKGRKSPILFTKILRNRMGDIRITEGFGLSIHDKLYLLGNLNSGEALEIAAFSDFVPAKTINSGLALSISATAELLSARIVFRKVPSKIDTSELGRKSYKEIESEIKNFSDVIANKVEFGLIQNLLFEGREINQSDMVSKVAELLTHKDGRPMFTYGNGDVFNPASSKHYTYNSALRAFSSGN